MEVGLLVYVEFFGPDTVLSTSIAQLKTTVRYVYTKWEEITFSEPINQISL